GAAGSEFQLSILQRCLIAGRDFWFYLFKLIWPAKLTFIYPRWNVSGAVWWEYLFPIGALLLLACAWHLRNRNRGPLAVALIFLGLLFPALGFIDVFPFLYSFVADHFQYLACAAPLTLFAAGVAVAVEKIAPTAKNFLGPVVSLALLSTLGFLSWQQAHDYHDVETLWRTTIVRNPSCWMAYSNLGSFLSGMGLTDEAIQNFRKALELRPDQSKDRNNLGKALLQQGRFMEAMEEFQAALKILPNDPVAENNIGAAYLEKGDVDNAIDYLGKAVHDGPRNADAYINFGNALLKKQDFDAAIAAYSRTLDLPFDQAESHYSIANALRQKGENGEAILSYKFAIQLRPDYVDAHNNLANALRQQGRIEEAIQEYEAALKYRPQFHLAQNNLAWILATAADSRLRNGSKAVELAEKAVIATNGNDPIFLHTLAAAYAENGEFEKAVAAAQDALAIADASGLTSLAESLNSMIALFKSGSAYRESASTPQESSH
ncbi:MAG: tetratricopeptide repeat protein, partial [Verrucomicrobia bacterium]|nr:tetratricopeptide repeat protein [Verrucomicrobiota bacterium]